MHINPDYPGVVVVAIVVVVNCDTQLVGVHRGKKLVDLKLITDPPSTPAGTQSKEPFQL
jgi:hypothetical protein